MQHIRTEDGHARGGSAVALADPPVAGRPARSAPAFDKDGAPPKPGPRVGRADVVLLATQLAIMVDTGVPIAEGLRSVARRTTDARFGDLLDEITESVEAGEPLSHALARHPRSFPPIMVALLRASEASGTMAAMLDRIARYLAKEHQTLKQVRGALLYPAFMFTMCLGITVFLLTVIMPRFVTIYESRGSTLPLLTRILMGASEIIVGHWPLCIAGALGAIVAVALWRATPLGRRQLDWMKLRVPVLGGVCRKLYLSRMCRTLGTMIETGVPLLECISIARGVTRNAAYTRLWDRLDDDLRQGRPFSEALFDTPVVPEHVAQMIESGETAGRLGAVLSRVADYCEAEFDQTVKTATQFIEPVMIVVMGSIIGIVAIALLVPIFGVGQVVAGG